MQPLQLTFNFTTVSELRTQMELFMENGSGVARPTAVPVETPKPVAPPVVEQAKSTAKPAAEKGSKKKPVAAVVDTTTVGAAVTPEVKTPTDDQVMVALKKVHDETNDMGVVLALLKSHGSKRASAIAADKRVSFIQACDAAVTAHKAEHAG